MDVYDYDEVYGFEGLGVEFFTHNVKLCTFVHILGIELKYTLYQSVYGESMKEPKLENSNPQGVERAGEGAFSPTPSETAQIKKVWIDLSGLDLSLKTSAAELLRDILINYRARVLILISFGDQFEILNDFRGIAHRIFKEEENDEVAIQKAAEELARLWAYYMPITIVMLYTGRETAVAFVRPRE